MKVLFLVRDLPWPINSGARIRAHNLAVRLARRHDLTLVGYAGACTSPEPPGASPFRRIVAVPEPSAVRGARLALGVAVSTFSRLPYAVSKHMSQAMSDAVDSLLSQEAFDLIHCDSLPLAPYAAAAAVPKVLDEHNVEWALWARHARFGRGISVRAYALLQAIAMRQFEAKACKLFDECVAVSDLDAAALRELCPPARVSVVPNGVDTDAFRPVPVAPVPGRLVFVGSMDWMANQDGIRWFAEQAWPRLRRRCPHVSLCVVGRRPSTRMVKLASAAGFDLIPDALDVRPYVAQAEAFIVPLRIGGGTRLKILEALAMQKPVVSTSVGAEGLALAHGKHLLIADDPDAFTAAVERVLKEPAFAAGLAAQGREAVVSAYDWDRLADVLECVWERAVRGGKARFLGSVYNGTDIA